MSHANNSPNRIRLRIGIHPRYITMRNRKETPPLKETYMDEIRKFGPKRNLHRILRFRQNGSKRNLHSFRENGAKRREKNKVFRHKNEFLKGGRDILEHAVRSAARKFCMISRDFWAPKETYMAFEKLEFWPEKEPT